MKMGHDIRSVTFCYVTAGGVGVAYYVTLRSIEGAALRFALLLRIFLQLNGIS